MDSLGYSSSNPNSNSNTPPTANNDGLRGYTYGRFDTSLNPTCDVLASQEENKEDHPLWNGHLSVINQSEIVCKTLYKKFYLHPEVSVILGNWKSVLHEQHHFNAVKKAGDIPGTQGETTITSTEPKKRVSQGLESKIEKMRIIETQSNDGSGMSSSSTSSSSYSANFFETPSHGMDPKILTQPVGSPSKELLGTPKMRWSHTQPSKLPSQVSLSEASAEPTSVATSEINPTCMTESISQPISEAGTEFTDVPASAGECNHEQGSSMVISSKKGVISVLNIDFFECIVFPYFSSYSVPEKEAKMLKSVFGRTVVDKIDAFIRDEYQGEQPPGSAFIIETHTEPCKFVVCVSVSRDPSYIALDYAYNAFRAALLAIHTFNKYNPDAQITKVLCPAFEAPNVPPFNVGIQMAACYMYWDWNVYPSGTLPPLTSEVIEDITTKIRTKAPSREALAQDLESMVAGKLLEGRGIVYESELNIMMAWIDGSVASPFPRAELARLLVKIARKPSLAPFTLNSSFIYTHMTPAVLEYLLMLCRTDFLQIYEDIIPEEIIWGESFAQGTSGRVFRGEWRGEAVAIKKFFVADPPVVKNELALISLLKHPNLVECYGGFTGEESSSFVTELLDCNLFDLLRTKTTLDFYTKIKLAIDIAEGMLFLHERNIIHRDLKSVNVLIRLGTIDMIAKVCDFGLSRVQNQTGHMTGNVGTVAWIAPEVFQSKKYSEKCDVYSFGVILFEFLTHSTPFKETPAFRIPQAVIKGKRPTLPEDALNAPKAFISLMKHCWHQNPARRPSFAEILTVLSSLTPHTAPISLNTSTNGLYSPPQLEDNNSSDYSSEDSMSLSRHGTLQEMEEQVFNEFKNVWTAKHGRYVKHALIDDALLLKCLRARKHVIKDARNLLQNYLAWYKYLTKSKPIKITDVRRDLENRILFYSGVNDMEGCPVLFLNANKYYVSQYPVLNLTRVLVYCLERVTEREDVQTKGITLVANIADYKMSNLSFKTASAFFESLKGSFPVITKQILFVDSPSWIPRLLMSIAPIVGGLMSKIIFVTSETLKNYIAADNIVPELGGRSNFDLSKWIRSRYESEQIEYQ